MTLIFLKSLLIGYSGAIMPGPMFTYTVEKSIKNGVKTGILVSAGHSILELALIIVIFFGAGKYLSNSIAITAIGLVGGITLVYMGFEMIRDIYLKRVTFDTVSKDSSKHGNMLVAGVVLSATNPYFIIWWSAVGLALIMSAYSTFGIVGILIFYIGHILADISWFTLVAALISKTKHLINMKIYNGVVVALAGCLIYFGTSFFWNSISNIIK